MITLKKITALLLLRARRAARLASSISLGLQLPPKL